MVTEKITIIGAGNGGFAAAADLAIRGHQVTLFEMPEFAQSIEEIQKTGYIELECLESNGLKGGKAYLHLITTDIKKALENAEIVFIIAPSYAHEPMAEVVAPYITDNMIVVLTPANFGGSIMFRRALIAHGCSEKVRVAEFDTMMYATRKKGNTGSWIRGYKHNLGCAVFPSDSSDEVFEHLKGIYPYLVKRENVLITGVSNINSYGHPACMLGNIPRIDMAAGDKEKNKWKMNEGKTDSVCKLRAALDKEHMGLKKVGFNVVSAIDIYKEYYNYQYQYEHPGTDPAPTEVWRNNPIYVESIGPDSWQHRYLTEDIPFGLVPIEELLDMCQLPHPVISSMINLANCLCERDFRKEGLTLEKVGIKNMGMKQLKRFLATGTCEVNS